MSSIGFCPECGQRIKLGGHPRIRQRVVCSECETNLEVTNSDPVELDIYVPAPKPRSSISRRAVTEIACPECRHLLNLGAHPFLHQTIVCPRCHTQLEVLNLNPLELDELTQERTIPNRRSNGKSNNPHRHAGDNE